MIPETADRLAWYGGAGVPDVRIDGRYAVIGATTCEAAHDAYLEMYTLRMQETGGTSPVGISGFMTSRDGEGSFDVRVTLLDPADLGDVQVTVMLYENGLEYQGQFYDVVTRLIASEPVSLAGPGDSVWFRKAFTLDPAWNPDSLGVFAILQERWGQKTVIQAASLERIDDFSVGFPAQVASVRTGIGQALLPGTVVNESDEPDVIDLSFEGFGWPADVQPAGDPGWHPSVSVPVGPHESLALTVRVTTDGMKRIGSGTLRVHSSRSGRTRPVALRVFNGAPALLFVDDDGGTAGQGVPFDLCFREGLDQLGFLFDAWDVENAHGGAGPIRNALMGYDAVIWETAYQDQDLIRPLELDALRAYLDEGGSLFLSSMDYLSTVEPSDPFVTGYLGVATWSNSVGAVTARGAEGDPITSGLVLPLTWPGMNDNRVDEVDPGPQAATIFRNDPGQPIAVRTELDSGARVVFSTVCQNAVSTSAPDPDNSRAVIGRVVDWLTAMPAAGVPVPSSGESSAPFRLLCANPFRPPGEIEIRRGGLDGAWGGSLRVGIFDLFGRPVRMLWDRGAPPERVLWDGKDERGRPVPGGFVFVMVSSGAVARMVPLVVVR